MNSEEIRGIALQTGFALNNIAGTLGERQLASIKDDLDRIEKNVLKLIKEVERYAGTVGE